MKSQEKILLLSSESDVIHIPSHEKRIFLDTRASGDMKKMIILAEGSECAVYGFRTDGKIAIEIIHEGSWSRSYVGYALFSAEHSVDLHLAGRVRSSDSISDIRVLSLAGNGGNAMIDGTIEVDVGATHVVGSVEERHIFLGATGKIRGIPALLVHSDDVKAHHSLAIERISDEELFYLRSRGFCRDEATIIMLESSIIRIFSPFGQIFPEQCRTIVAEIMKCIHENISWT